VARASETPGQRVERTFSQDDHGAPRQARAAIANLEMDECVRQDVMIVASELVANAVRHSPRVPGGRIVLTVARQARSVRVEVRDSGRGFDPQPDPSAEGGLGLVIVGRIALDWGVVVGERTLVWCEVGLAR
jgi:anti-sigma regulatory factor (Ser/Thr protein kinase)